MLLRPSGQLLLLVVVCATPFVGFYARNQAEGVDASEVALYGAGLAAVVLAGFVACRLLWPAQSSRGCCALAV